MLAGEACRKWQISTDGRDEGSIFRKKMKVGFVGGWIFLVWPYKSTRKSAERKGASAGI